MLMRLLLLSFYLVVFSFPSIAQSGSISLDSCYILVKENYPLVRQYDLIKKSTDFSLANLSKGNLPQMTINGQATYQSDVTQFPASIPGVSVLSKDQYKIAVDLNQAIYDGGRLKAQQNLEMANSAVEEQNIEVQLYQLKRQINELFFGILLLNEQILQADLTKEDIQLGLDRANARIADGVGLRSGAAVLKAELLKLDQQIIALKSNRDSFIDRLGLFINRPLSVFDHFIKPSRLNSSMEIVRPELNLFDFQNQVLDVQNELLSIKNRPVLSLFGQGGFGRPAFNILSNNFDPFYIGGLRLRIPLSGFYTLKNERALLAIQRKRIAVQKDVFLFNTQLSLKQEKAEIRKLNAFLETDGEIIALRTSVKNAALAQMENGVITSSDYLREVNAEDLAKQNRILHEIQLLLAHYNEQITLGN